MIVLAIDLESNVPIEQQIGSQIRELIALGQLKDGQPLPSARQLAGDLAVHFTTVARAYRRLQEEGLLVVGPGRGVFVRRRESRSNPTAAAARESLRGRVWQVLADGRLAGLTTAQMRDFFLRELERFAREEKRS